MLTIDKISERNRFLKTTQEREEFLTHALQVLTDHHINSCAHYKNIVASFFGEKLTCQTLEDLPYLPIGIFKKIDMLSVPKSSIVRTLNSSGTSGTPSRIFLDKTTAINQIKVLTYLLERNLGAKKIPMLVIDKPNSSEFESQINARTAAIKGFSIHASETVYLLDENSNPRIDIINTLAERFKDQEIFLFGFTFVIWENFLEKLEKARIEINLGNATLVHGGGWKNLSNISVTDELFKEKVHQRIGVSHVLNYYGMAEQTGSLYFECKESFLHTTEFGSVVIRNLKDFSVCKMREEGIVQVLSVIPLSYPGHSILTEDVGYLAGNGDCKCGRDGRYFKIIGRLPEAEIRGCSDAYGI